MSAGTQPLISLFSCPKPFRGHIGLIQQNAIESWLALGPKVQILLMGDDEGCEQVAREYGVTHVPQVERNSAGTPLISSLFQLAEENGLGRRMAYINCDVILMNDFLQAIECLTFERFVLIGQRWDVDLHEPLATNDSGWEERMRLYTQKHGELHTKSGMDYFVYPTGLFSDMPPFAVGRPAWDNWLIYSAQRKGAMVVDCTDVITAIHQNHEYSHHPQGMLGIWNGEEAKCNLALAGGMDHVFNIDDADLTLTPRGLQRRVHSREFQGRKAATFGIIYPHIDKALAKRFPELQSVLDRNRKCYDIEVRCRPLMIRLERRLASGRHAPGWARFSCHVMRMVILGLTTVKRAGRVILSLVRGV